LLLLLLSAGCQAANPLYGTSKVGEGGSGGSGGKTTPPARVDGGAPQGSGGNDGTGGSGMMVMDPAPGDDAGSPDVLVDDGGAGPADAGADSTPAPPAMSAELAKGLALYLPLDERPGTSVAADASGKKASAQLRSIDAVSAWTTGAAGQALALRGTTWNGWVDVNGQALPSALSQSFSVAMWVRRETSDGTAMETLISRTAVGAKGPLFALSLDAGTLTAQLNSTAAYNLRLRANGTIPAQRWVHVAVTYDLRQVRLYVDGNAVGAGQYAQAIPLDTTSFMIGGLEQSNRTVGARFAGQIDEVLLLTRVLTVNEVTALANGARPATR
jgi:hypothetical protein